MLTVIVPGLTPDPNELDGSTETSAAGGRTKPGYASIFRRAAHRFRCAAAIRFRVAALNTRRFLGPVSTGTARDIHFGGRPLRFPPPIANR